MINSIIVNIHFGKKTMKKIYILMAFISMVQLSHAAETLQKKCETTSRIAYDIIRTKEAGIPRATAEKRFELSKGSEEDKQTMKKMVAQVYEGQVKVGKNAEEALATMLLNCKSM
jgi:hypothetical protein